MEELKKAIEKWEGITLEIKQGEFMYGYQIKEFVQEMLYDFKALGEEKPKIDPSKVIKSNPRMVSEDFKNYDKQEGKQPLTIEERLSRIESKLNL